MLHLLVTGSRTWDDPGYIYGILTRLMIQHGAIELHHGACPQGGADEHADAWGNAFALTRPDAIKVVRHPMNDHGFGKAAGPIRNTEMVKLFQRFMHEGKAVACHAFHRGNSHGTGDCANKALFAGIPVVRHVWGDDGVIRDIMEEQLHLFPLADAA